MATQVRVSGYARVTRTKDGGLRITKVKPYRRRTPGEAAAERDRDLSAQHIASWNTLAAKFVANAYGECGLTPPWIAPPEEAAP